MPDTDNSPILESVRQHAVRQLPYAKQQTTNLHLDSRIYNQGETIGPAFQKIVADRPSILVFADDEPRANFTHACRYILYDAKTGLFNKEVNAQLPPFDATKPSTLTAFHEPVRFIDQAINYPIQPIFRCPIVFPEGSRYAILFAGMSNKRHLNDMEFLYRTLVDNYGMDKKNIQALSYDGTLNTQDGVQTHWPGDGTPYRIKITGQGTRAALETALDNVKGKLKSLDQLLIHTNNHGGWDGVSGSAYLCTYPSWSTYYNADFSTKLGTLPKYRNLIVMMEQCHAGGFNASVLAKSTASATSIASAATEPNNSYVSADGNWDPFARDWVAAQAGHTPFGTALAFNPDTDADGRIEAEEAFAYANAVRDPLDSPNFSESSEAGGDIALGQQYIVYHWWCPILFDTLKAQYAKLPPEEYYTKVNAMQPELQKMTASLDQASGTLRKETLTKLTALVNSTFGGVGRSVGA
jgi:hypothetical protein